jgi:hypothetical protein
LRIDPGAQHHQTHQEGCHRSRAGGNFHTGQVLPLFPDMMSDADVHTPPKILMGSFALRCNDFNQSKHNFRAA